MRVAVTGASGFIGGHLLTALRQQGTPVVPLVRRPLPDGSGIPIDLSKPDELASGLADVDVLVHCAGWAHAHGSDSLEQEERHKVVNCAYVLNAANAAAQAGVKRFVFLSSVKAVGEPGTQCVDESFDIPAMTPYGRAKRAAEEGLRRIGQTSGMEIVILRLSMVYGPGSHGNLERMLRLVAKGRFPPLPDTGNKRSMVHVSDVVEAVWLAISRAAAANRIFIVAHPQAVSGRELYGLMRQACCGSESHWAVPEWMFRLAGRIGDFLTQRLHLRSPLDSETVSRLLDSACYSSDALRTALQWTPQIDTVTGIKLLAFKQRLQSRRREKSH